MALFTHPTPTRVTSTPTRFGEGTRFTVKPFRA